LEQERIDVGGQAGQRDALSRIGVAGLVEAGAAEFSAHREVHRAGRELERLAVELQRDVVLSVVRLVLRGCFDVLIRRR
jgi:hypothetical protein